MSLVVVCCRVKGLAAKVRKLVLELGQRRFLDAQYNI